MARRPILTIDGVTYPNVYEVTYNVYTSFDETGRPADRAHAGLIRIVRESDEKTDVARWAMDSSAPNWKSGSISFLNPDDKEMKVLTWDEGFITSYDETIPHLKERPSDQMYETFHISAHRISIGSEELDNRWKE